MSITVAPQKSHNIDAFDDPVMLSRPMSCNQSDILGIRSVKGGIIQYWNSFAVTDKTG
jgi:hypothetical protein